jgi:small subunit ribosomal protein S6
MPDTKMNVYEGMFLFPQSATAELQTAIDHINELLARADAEIISLSKWDERRLAYDIKGNRRGVYFLTYFRADGTKLTDLERAGNLSEKLLRFMITRADHIEIEQMQAVDGQQQLADEIALRDQEAAPASAE